MDELLFKVNPECGVPPIPKVDFQFVEDCVIPAPPKPIFDCSPPVPPPPEIPPICPEISGTITVATHVAGRTGSSCGQSSSQSASGTIEVSKSTNCEFNIAVNLDIPIPSPPCPIINAKTPVVNVGYAKCLSSSSNIFKVTPTPTCDPEAPCEFELELEIAVPIPEPRCPVIKTKTFKVDVGYSDCLTTTNKFEITSSSIPPECPDDPGTCAFDIDLEIAVPIPKPRCPIITAKPPKVEVGYSDCLTTSNKIEITTTEVPPSCPEDPGTCAFDIEVQLAIPIPKPRCPIIKGGDTRVTTGYEGCVTPGNSRITVIPTPIPPTCPNDPGTCEFTIELDLEIPIPRPVCPVVKEGNVNVQTGFEGCIEPVQRFRITKTEIPASCPNTPPTCEFEINLDLALALPKPPCPVFETTTKLTTLPPTQPPYLNFYSNDYSQPDCSNEPGQCAFEFVIDLGIPQPCVPVFITKPATLDNGNISLTDGNWMKETIILKKPGPNCDYEIEEFMQVPKTVDLVKGDIQAQWTDCNSQPDLFVTIDKEETPQGVVTKYILNMLLTIPKFPTYTGGAIDLGAYGSGQITVTEGYDCQNKIGGQITLITDACSTGSGGGSNPPCDPSDPDGGCYEPGGGSQQLRMPLEQAAEQPMQFSLTELITELRQNKELRNVIREILYSVD